jgi:hypothetical protein
MTELGWYYMCDCCVVYTFYLSQTSISHYHTLLGSDRLKKAAP